jgi:hypothetical protein
MLVVNREKRFQSMEELISAIDGKTITHRLVMFGSYACAAALILLMGMVLERLFQIL